MQTNLFFGGAQSPLSRAFLRAATIPYLDLGGLNPKKIYANMNDIDTPGIRPGDRQNSFLTDKKLKFPIEAKEVWARTEKEEWLPISWKLPFHKPKSYYMVNVGYPENLIIKGLPFERRVKDTLILGSFAEVDAVIEIVSRKEFLDRLKHKESVEILERAFRLKQFILNAVETTTSINDFWVEIARFMLHGKMARICTNPLSDLFNFSSETAANDQFYLLERFLAHPEKCLSLYSEFKPSPTGIFPFWAVHKNNEWASVRETISRKKGGRIYVGNNEIGTGVKSVDKLAEVLQSTDLGPISIVPKVFLLIPTFRYMGVHYCTDPNYMADVQQFVKRIKIRQNPLLVIKHDATKALPSNLWTMCCQFLKFQNPGIDNTEYNKQVNEWKFNSTLTFLWLLGGENAIENLIQKADRKLIC